jgi:hypothetical protein
MEIHAGQKLVCAVRNIFEELKHDFKSRDMEIF